ncbi:MAG TPA: universal stress protein, partial [Gemmatimonadaceae bacterium]|nr:universal stress protein [Gemmatimonadaceae bacterium]
NGIDVAFTQIIAALAPTPGMTITPVRRVGAPVLELTAACEALQPDLFAIGSQRHPFIERVRLGSVAAAMAKDGRWSMLVTPPATVASTPPSA